MIQQISSEIPDLTTVLQKLSSGSTRLQAGPDESGRPLGQLLLAESLINRGQLEQVLVLQQGQLSSARQRLGELLINQRLVSRQDINSLLARKFGIPRVRLEQYQIPAEVLSRVPAHLVLQYRLVPVALAGQRLLVASETPWDNEGMELLRFHTGLQPEWLIASGEDIAAVMGRYYSQCDEDEALRDSAPRHGPANDLQSLEQQANKRPIVRLLNTLILQGLERHASDIHIRPTEQLIEVYYRLDGRMQRIRTLPRALLPPLVSRAKILARLDIAERRLPQDGHARFQRDQYQTDLRLSIIPTIHGESVVIRLLDPLTGVRQLADLGLPHDQYQALQRLAGQRSGLILVVGPTGAGKSTTLYALLDQIRRDGRHILSVEDPVEYQIEGVEQVQVNERKGLRFSNVLRHFLRHDPDVIMVGEIRDQATAELAVRAAMTGHLVMSTLHTRDAPATVIRLLNMGVEPYLLSSTLLAVMAQGLIRVNCRHCRVEDRVDATVLHRLGLEPGHVTNFVKGSGCPHCHHSGYKGRRVIAELMPVDEMLAQLINRRAPLPLLRQHALSRGMKPMREQAWALVRKGDSSLEELMSLGDV